MDRYYKEIDGETVWYKEPLKYKNKQIFGAKESQIIEAGWIKYIEPTLSQEELDKMEAMHRIGELKSLLREGDYQVIKCAEANLLGEEMPYNITELFTQRDTYREEINTLQEKYNITY